VLPRPWEEVEEARLNVTELPVASACTGRRRPRRIDDDGAPAGGSTWAAWRAGEEDGVKARVRACVGGSRWRS
jgi:hypothetical protein